MRLLRFPCIKSHPSSQARAKSWGSEIIYLILPDFLRFIAGGLLKFGEDPLLLSEEAFQDYAYLLNRSYTLRTEKPYPEIFEYLGFCTWNTFYRDQSLDNIQKLTKANFTPPNGTTRFKYLIMDDGWQPTNEFDLRQDLTPPVLANDPLYLTSLETNYKFPGGLAPVATLLKKQYNFRWFGVWHTVNGYWSGIHPDSLLAKKYKCVRVGTRNTIDPFAPSGYQFWFDYFEKMRQGGIDLVKIDNTTSVANLFEGVYPFDHAVAKTFDTEHAAAAVHDITILNCLGAAHDAKIHWSYSNAARISNDFGPGNFRGTKTQIHQCPHGPVAISAVLLARYGYVPKSWLSRSLDLLTYDFGWADISGRRCWQNRCKCHQ